MRQARLRSTLPALGLLLALAGCSLRNLDDLARAEAAAGDAADAAAPDQPAPEPARPEAVDVAAEATPTEASAPLDAAAEAPEPADVASAPDLAPETAPDLPPDAAPFPRAILIVGALALDASDASIAARLSRLRLEVAVHDDDLIAALDPAPAALIVISPSSESTKLGDTLKLVRRPIVACDRYIYNDLDLAAAGQSPAHYGTHLRETTVNMVSTPNPLTAALSGLVTVTSAPATYGYAVPRPSAIGAATITGHPDHYAIFGYDEGAMMVSVRAPARRVGFFLSPGAAAVLTPAGWSLFDAAVSWALGK